MYYLQPNKISNHGTKSSPPGDPHYSTATIRKGHRVTDSQFDCLRDSASAVRGMLHACEIVSRRDEGWLHEKKELQAGIAQRGSHHTMLRWTRISLSVSASSGKTDPLMHVLFFWKSGQITWQWHAWVRNYSRLYVDPRSPSPSMGFLRRNGSWTQCKATHAPNTACGRRRWSCCLQVLKQNASGGPTLPRTAKCRVWHYLRRRVENTLCLPWWWTAARYYWKSGICLCYLGSLRICDFKIHVLSWDRVFFFTRSL